MRNQHVVGATIVYCVLVLAIGLAGAVVAPPAVFAEGNGGPEPPTGASAEDSTYGTVDESTTDDTALQERAAQQSLTIVDFARLAIETIL